MTRGNAAAVIGTYSGGVTYGVCMVYDGDTSHNSLSWHWLERLGGAPGQGINAKMSKHVLQPIKKIGD